MTTANTDDEALLGEICKQHEVPLAVLNQLIELENDLLGMGRRHGLYEKIGEILENATSRPQ